MSRLEPRPSEASAAYWEATRDKRLVLQWCLDCNAPVHFPRVVCPGCLGSTFDYREASGRATVHAVVVEHRPPSPFDDDQPYALALGPRCYRGVIESTEHGGFPLLEHLRLILEGPVVWAPAVDGAVVLSQRGGDFEITVGEDFSIGFAAADVDAVQLYIEESAAFRVNTPEAAVHLAYPADRPSGSKRGK